MQENSNLLFHLCLTIKLMILFLGLNQSPQLCPTLICSNFNSILTAFPCISCTLNCLIKEVFFFLLERLKKKKKQLISGSKNTSNFLIVQVNYECFWFLFEKPTSGIFIWYLHHLLHYTVVLQSKSESPWLLLLSNLDLCHHLQTALHEFNYSVLTRFAYGIKYGHVF